MFIIRSGTVDCTQNDKTIRTLGRGEFFGEQALLYDHGTRTASVKACEETECLSLSSTDLQSILGSALQSVLY
jgi:cGMP-dependent protein kinase